MSFPYLRIFAALDGASTQEAVARRAVALAAASGAQLLFGHVGDVAPSDTNGSDFEALAQEEQVRIEQELAGVLAEARANPAIPSCSLEVRVGRVPDVLVEQFVGPYEPDLVVCGERGLSDIKYAFVGSVSRHLVRTVRADVLVVKQGGGR